MENAVNKIHVGVYGVIRDGERIALILKGRGPYTGMLDLPGGKIEYGESVEECLGREIQEELGGEVKSAELKTVLQNSIIYEENGEMVNFQHIGIIFEVTLKNNSIQNVNQHDVLESKWFDCAELDRENLTFLAKYAI